MEKPRNKPPIPQEVICISCGIIFKTIFENDFLCEKCKEGDLVIIDEGFGSDNDIFNRWRIE